MILVSIAFVGTRVEKGNLNENVNVKGISSKGHQQQKKKS